MVELRLSRGGGVCHGEVRFSWGVRLSRGGIIVTVKSHGGHFVTVVNLSRYKGFNVLLADQNSFKKARKKADILDQLYVSF